MKILCFIFVSFLFAEGSANQTLGSKDLLASSKHSIKIKLKHKYKLTIAAIFKDEGPYLKEWIEFHLLMGVEHFYLYNNLSSDNYYQVLTPYIKAGIVELIDWPYVPGNWNKIQCDAYMNCIERARGKAKWIAFLDIDEFLFPVQEDNLVKFLKNYEECSGLTANWVMYGTSWIEKVPENALLIEMLHLKGNILDKPLVKSIVRPERVKSCQNPHNFSYKKGYTQVNADKVAFTGPFAPYTSTDKIRINHYWTRDEYYLQTFKIPRRQNWGNSTITEEMINTLNAESDTAIFRFIPELKKRMNLQ